MDTKMRVGIFASDAGTLAQIQDAVQRVVEGASVTILDPKGRLHMLKAESVDVLIVQSGETPHAVLPAIAELSQKNPNLAVLLLSPLDSADVLRDAMRAGVREVLLSPVSQDELCRAIERTQARLAGSSPRQKGRILTFIACKGGSGATFLATNLAYVLAKYSHKKTLLIDLDLQYGDASFFVQGSQTAASVVEVARQSAQLDAGILTSTSLEIAPNLSFLAAPEEPEQAMSLRPEQIDHLLSVAVQVYDFVIIDLERSFDTLTIKVLDHADLVFVVTQLLVPYARNTKKLMKLLRSLGYADKKVQLIANRTDRDVDLPVKRIESTIGAQIHRFIPNDFDNASASSGMGVPMLQQAPGSAVSRALKDFADELTGNGHDHASWLKSFFRSSTGSE